MVDPIKLLSSCLYSRDSWNLFAFPIPVLRVQVRYSSTVLEYGLFIQAGVICFIWGSFIYSLELRAVACYNGTGNAFFERRLIRLFGLPRLIML